ncbi:hypothetical protein SAMN04487870_1237 [Pseudoalteromonas sp. DSM 26666]|uniref:hypothetical protein n=1 Tax=Pseudoalteromonas sp. DSM 26666 TaxID=1761892 RepID=UPI0008F0FB5B|nr:hypothetical protein [Pseudoalteromonas sp. DSM 26666]SFT64827.1 hypothetical protein SAMN04487870_1237 [Pseudoalteromonas sp. DSM 26666]
MHAVAPYLFRCFNRELEGRVEQRYSTLDNLGDKDLFFILRDFLQGNTGAYKIIEETKQVYQFDELQINEQTREIYGWFNVGTYGMKTDIINVATGVVDFEKAKNNAEIIKHYVHYFIPRGFNEAMAFMHSYRGDGVKTLFYNLFLQYFKAQTDLVIQMNPLAYDNAVNAWLDATAKEVKLTKFVGLNDIADQVRLLGHGEQELIIKPPRRGSMGRLRDYLNLDSPHRQAVEIMGEYGAQVKTVVEMNGKRRTFNVGRNKTNALCEIEVDEEVVGDDGVPDFVRINAWVKEIITEYSRTMYPGINIRVA